MYKYAEPQASSSAFQLFQGLPQSGIREGAGGQLRCWHPEQRAKNILEHFVRSGLYSGTEDRAVDGQKKCLWPEQQEDNSERIKAC